MKKIYLISFLVILIIPNIIMFGGFEKNLPNLENRRFQKLNDINISNPIQAVKDFKKYYNDNFGYKRTVLKTYTYLKNEVIDENPLPNKVVIGKNGWYFLGNSDQNVFNNSVIEEQLTSIEFKTANQNIENITNGLIATKIPFYFFIPPNKHNVYINELPFKKLNTKSKFDTLINHWGNKVSIISPLKEIKKASLKTQTYHKTDTHWNDFGAFTGYQKLISEINIDFKNIEIPKIENYNFKTEKVLKMDLTSMINKKIIENKIVLEPKQKTNSYTIKRDKNIHYINDSKPLKVLIFRDSFSLAMIQFYRETFGECIFIKSHTPNLNLIKKENPDLIIWQMVERNLNILCNKKI